MANIRDILRRTLSKMGEDFETSDIVDWFNDCINELTDILYLPTSATITRNTSGVFALPTNYNNQLTVYLKDGGDKLMPLPIGETGKGYVFGNGVIRLVGYPEQSSLFISYNRKPAAIQNNPDQVPDIPEQFHRIFEHYACAIAMLSDEEHERYAMYNQQYLRVRSQLQNYMNRLRSSHSPVKAWEVVR